MDEATRIRLTWMPAPDELFSEDDIEDFHALASEYVRRYLAEYARSQDNPPSLLELAMFIMLQVSVIHKSPGSSAQSARRTSQPGLSACWQHQNRTLSQKTARVSSASTAGIARA